MFDAHTHLNSDKLFPSWKQHTYDFIEVWGTHLITVWIDTVYNTRNIDICSERLQDPRTSECIIKSSLGIHPCSVGSQDHVTQDQINTQVEVIQSLITNNAQHVVAVWECGIDAHRWDYTAIKSLQWYTFEQQCKLAQHLDLPIIIHTRSERPDTLAILSQFKDLKIYLHCRWYTQVEIQQAAHALPHLRVGFCGNTTYPKAESLRTSLQTARSLQEEWWCKVVIETDAPYLAPQNRRGKMNTPVFLRESWKSFAQVVWIDNKTLFDITSQNSKKLYTL
jgi:TatD DNase family protein